MSSAKPIGDISAKCPKCPKCGKQAFTAPAGPKLKPQDMLTCSGCGHVVRYSELVAQIDTEFLKRADKLVGDLVKSSKKRR